MSDAHEVYGARHPRVRRLRAIARDARARADEAACLVEGPRVIDAALDRRAPLVEVWFGHGARRGFPDLAARLDAAGVPSADLKEGVLEKLGTTRTPQPVLAVAEWTDRPLDALPATGFTVVAVDVADPGNLGTLVRSAEAAGADGVVVTGESVDVRNPKVVRASAGAVFGVPVTEIGDTGEALDALRARGTRTCGAIASGGVPPAAVDLARGAAIVVGNEARGLASDVVARLDTTVTIPMAGVAESLNVAMAATVLCFEAARQRDTEAFR